MPSECAMARPMNGWQGSGPLRESVCQGLLRVMRVCIITECAAHAMMMLHAVRGVLRKFHAAMLSKLHVDLTRTR